MENEKLEKSNRQRFFDRRTIEMTAILTLGTFIYSVGVVWLLNCGEFFAGGITGISQLLSHIFFGEVSPLLSIFIPLLNIPLFILGWKSISKKFAFLTAVSVVLQMIFIYFFTWLCQDKGFNPIFEVVKRYDEVLTIDGKYVCANNNAGLRLLLAFIGGFVCGIGNVLCLRSGGSSGGMDVIANALLVKKSISLTKISFIIDGTIVFLSGFVCDVSTALFTFVRLISSIMTVDRFYRIYNYIRIEIVTEKHEEMRTQLLQKLHHGITIYSVIGGYTMKEKKVLQIFASKYETNDYLMLIKTIDPEAFITVSNISSLIGKYNKRTII